MIPTGCECNTNISRTSWNWHFTKSMSSGEGEREEVIGGSGSDRGSVGDDSLACMTSYLWNSVMKNRHLSRTSCGCPPEMFDELLTRVGQRITKHNGNYKETLDPGLKLALTLRRHIAAGTKYHSMSYGWRVRHNTISLLIPKVCQAIIDKYKDEVMKCPTTPEEWRAISSDKFAKR